MEHILLNKTANLIFTYIFLLLVKKMFLLDFSSRSHFGFCNGHGNSRTAWHVTRWSHEEVPVKMATTSDGDLYDFSESSEPVNSPVKSLWLSQNSQTILMIFGSLLRKLNQGKQNQKEGLLRKRRIWEFLSSLPSKIDIVFKQRASLLTALR